ncbi:rod shape-determining protein MreC [Kordiimonas aestuarii]|uniref:rod shape-determining protein MreC n=1 Tax=Kordiimonas aestuarii TaxID=1005925 RepID=UPI0021D14B06|nr:rod shape-determining protein MreC [Kordiimonas aestuarii]
MWLYMVLAVVLLGLEATGQGLPSQLRAYANDFVSPVLRLLEQPIRAVQAGLERIAGVGDIYLENQTLRDENDRLRQWREAAMQLSRENERLRQMLKVPGREVPPAATARVIGVGGGAFERNVLISAGISDGVRRNLPVVDESGVIGRTIQVGRWTSRVLLVTDLNSRIPVRLERTGDLAIAEGQNEAFLMLRFLPEEIVIREGDRLLTSGHGGVFPPDLPVARVSEVGEGYVRLDPLGILGKLDYVRVLDYHAVPDEDAIALPPKNGEAGEQEQQP